ncbi:MAG: DUF58 domain-containing protein [Deltaproteobacteria bacterium]|nr:DUF58 domain-containing protein [Deltaproteobacteria bacterium]
MELHDFREYQPGDDLRHLDWNAVGRTGRLILRVRKEEVAPRVEILVDASRSMAITERKRERARELAALFEKMGRAQGLTPVLHWLADSPRRAAKEVPTDFDARRPLGEALSRIALRPCGVRVLISDLLFEAPLGPIFRRLADGAARLAVVQVLDPDDEDPQSGEGARLVDSETDEALDRLLGWDVLQRYRKRLAAHLAAIEAEARRVRAAVCRVTAGEELEACVRERLVGSVVEPRGR